MDRLSGDQNETSPFSVPASCRAEEESRGRTHNRVSPETVAANTMFFPSGETANELKKFGFVVGGVVISNRTSGAAGFRRRTTAALTTLITITRAKAEIHARRRFVA